MEFQKTETVFVVPFALESSVILPHNRRRGFEILGGHIESGQDFVLAAKRELKEELRAEANIPIGLFEDDI